MRMMQIHMPGGNIDLSFRVKGHKGELQCPQCIYLLNCFPGAGTLYFTSIRRVKGEPFQIRECYYS